MAKGWIQVEWKIEGLKKAQETFDVLCKLQAASKRIEQAGGDRWVVSGVFYGTPVDAPGLSST